MMHGCKDGNFSAKVPSSQCHSSAMEVKGRTVDFEPITPDWKGSFKATLELEIFLASGSQRLASETSVIRLRRDIPMVLGLLVPLAGYQQTIEINPRREKMHEGEKGSWQRSLEHICKGECQDIMKEMEDKANHTVGEQMHFIDFFIDSNIIVKKVEAFTLGCCADACGWNGYSCTRWPFMAKNDKDGWVAECCSEFIVLQGSERELMCNSMLPGNLRNEMENNDRKPETTVSFSEIGQDRVLPGDDVIPFVKESIHLSKSEPVSPMLQLSKSDLVRDYSEAECEKERACIACIASETCLRMYEIKMRFRPKRFHVKPRILQGRTGEPG